MLSLEQTKAFLQEQIKLRRVYALTDMDDRLFGQIIFHPYDTDSYEIGWILDRAYWNRGIATEVTGALMHRQFECGEVRKTYVALLCGNVAADEGEVSLPLGADYHDRPRQKVDSERGKEARTNYRVLRRFARHVLVEFTPHTGRTHQLRVHSASSQGLRAAISGDTLYGGQTTVPATVAEILTRDYGMSQRGTAGIWLQSQSLRFTHPVTGEEVNIALKKQVLKFA